ncbi:putative lipoprotein LppN [Mycolicibacterium arabiense]|uniref:Putative lipoprotein LppN n=1 Tax=Mycolicibacterium arabiense TaxID=1286181 RepID=A0A7I7S7G2_9MYCO|nr:putative lipoprotein LppN [Mycolicibacterium arabiense]
MHRRPIIRVSVALLGISWLTGCAAPPQETEATSSAAPDSPTPSTSQAMPPPAPAAVTKQWVDLAVGECVAEVPAVDVGIATVSVVDCATPHRAEVYLLAPVAVDAAIADVGDQACASGVDAYTGGGRGDLSITYLIDSKQDRTGAIPLPSTVICLLQDAGGAPLTASVRG